MSMQEFSVVLNRLIFSRYSVVIMAEEIRGIALPNIEYQSILKKIKV
jgi:hypothetical protein